MKFWKSVFIIWIFFWLFFLIRGLYKGEAEEFKALLSRSHEARRAYIIGEELYEFLNFIIKTTPKASTYQIKGDIKPLDRYRLIYYLYPRMESQDPDYILCYNTDSSFIQNGFYKFETLKNDQFILKKKKVD